MNTEMNTSLQNEFITLKDFEGRYKIMKSYPYEIYDTKLKTLGNRVLIVNIIKFEK